MTICDDPSLHPTGSDFLVDVKLRIVTAMSGQFDIQCDRHPVKPQVFVYERAITRYNIDREREELT